jgi:glycosyltransferase involved in cell wall biosynthesis
VPDDARLTLAIPFHHGLAYLREAIESALAQTRSDWTLVVLDDRGEPAEAVQALVAGFGDRRLACRSNDATLGMVGNWNHALDVVETDLVTLLHADDRLLPDYAETVLGLASARPDAVALACAAEIIDARGRPRFSFADAYKRLLVPRGEPWRLAGEAGLHALLRGDFVMCPTLCWRRSVLGRRRFEAGWRQVQDLELLTRLLLEGETVIGTRRRSYAYRRHVASATEIQSENLLRFEEEALLYGRLAEAASARGWLRAARTARGKGILRLHLGFRAVADLAALRPGAAARKLRFLARLR